MASGERKIGKTTVCDAACARVKPEPQIVRIEVPERRDADARVLLQSIIDRCDTVSRASATRKSHSAELLTGRVAEYGQLQTTVAERPGLLVVTSDPWSGTSPMLRSVLEDIEHHAILVDAHRCRDAVDLAMAIADRAVSEFAPAAEP